MSNSVPRAARALCAALAACGAAQAAPLYHLVDLGPYITVTGLFDDDTVSGQQGLLATGLWHDGRWRWRAYDGWVTYDAAGDAVATQPMRDYASLVVRHPDGTLRPLYVAGRQQTLQGNATITPDGRAAATTYTDLSAGIWHRCAYWAPGESMGTILPTAYRANCETTAISAAGRVYGSAQVGRDAAYQAFSWAPLEDVPTFIASPADSTTFAWGVNAAGHVALSAGGTPLHAAWFDGTRIVDFPNPAGTIGSEATAINDADEMVGDAVPSAAGQMETAYRFAADGTATPLVSLVDNAAGWTLMSATAINNRGSIAGGGVLDGAYHAYLLQRLPD
jgi:hypothetical protein